jgi:hypothetical protein
MPIIIGRQRSGGSQFEASPGKKQDPISKISNTHKKRAGVTQEVEHLPSMCEVLSSNSSTIKKFIS